MREGVTKFICHHIKGNAPTDIDDLVWWRNVMRQRNFIGVDRDGAGFGNISRRRGNGFVISGTQTGHIGVATSEDFTLVTNIDIDANELRCLGPVAASSESMTHGAIYHAASWVNAVIHVHDDNLWDTLIDVVPATRPNVPYGTPGMAREFERLILETSFPIDQLAVMGGHRGGLVYVGADVDEAAGRLR